MTMRKRKFRQSYLLTGILLTGILLLFGCQKEEETGDGQAHESRIIEAKQDCPVSGLSSYLLEAAPEASYVCASILITGGAGDTEGKADISWESFSKAEEFQEYFSEREQEKRDNSAKVSGETSDKISGKVSKEISGGEAGYTMEWLYYQYRLPKGIHAIDINSFLKERYDKEDNPLYAITYDKSSREYYTFSQSGVREMVVKDDMMYVLQCQGSSENVPKDSISELLMDFGGKAQKNTDPYYSGWVMSDETLYWADHEERITRQENPSRTFTEVRGIDSNWSGRPYMEYFGMLKEAEYQVSLWEDGPLMRIFFEFSQEIPETGFVKYLLNGFCTDEKYRMTVTDLETDEILQERNISMSIELPDMITFKDLNGDGFSDMRIDLPTHWNGERAVVDEFADHANLYWDPEEEIFEFEKPSSVPQNNRDKTETEEGGYTEYLVKPGDTLWGISRRFYGTGIRYGEIEEKNEETLSRYRYLMPETVLKIPDSQ